MLTPEKTEFIEQVLHKGRIAIGQSTLTDGRTSFYKVHLRRCDGTLSDYMGRVYADMMRDTLGHRYEFEAVFGSAFSGIPLAGAAATEISRRTQRPMRFVYDKKKELPEGNISVHEIDDYISGWLLNNDRIVMVDDVITGARTKKRALRTLERCANGIQVLGLYVAYDRQEVAGVEDGKIVDPRSAIQTLQEDERIQTHFLITATDLLE